MKHLLSYIMTGDVELFDILQDNGQNCELNSLYYENKNMLVLSAQAPGYTIYSPLSDIMFVILRS